MTSSIFGELCVAPYVGVCAIPADLKTSHLTCSRLPSHALAHEKSIKPSTGQTCKKAPRPAQPTVFRGIHPSSVELDMSRLCLKSTI